MPVLVVDALDENGTAATGELTGTSRDVKAGGYLAQDHFYKPAKRRDPPID
jgi:hypothetical protein